MKKTSFAKMQGGWFIGNFKPAAHNINCGEAAVKKYVQGYVESSYCHEKASTLYVVISGEISFNGEICGANDVVYYGAGEVISLTAITNTIVMLVVVGDVKFIRGKDSALDDLEIMYAHFFSETGDERRLRSSRIKSGDISVVVQGAIDPQVTVNALDSIRRHLPDSKIILSTWKGSDVNGLDYDDCVFSADPGAHTSYLRLNPGKKFTNNTNRQLVSTQAGLKRVKTEYTLKLRSDMLLLNANFLGSFFSYPEHTNEYRIFKQRVIIPELFTRRRFEMRSEKPPIFMPFHISDWFCFGLTEDIQTYIMDTPLMPKSDMAYKFSSFSIERPERYLCSWRWRYAPEQYYTISAVQRCYPDIQFRDWTDWNDTNIMQSEKFITNNFIVLDLKRHGITMPKYEPQITSNNDGNYMIRGLYRFDLFEKYYKDVIVNKRKGFNWDYDVEQSPFRF